MFVAYYKTQIISEEAKVICLLGRSGLSKNNHPIGIKKQILESVLEGGFIGEGERISALCEEYDYQIITAVNPDIKSSVVASLGEIRSHKESNPNEKATLMISTGIYTPDYMFYLDWENRWASIQEIDPTLIGKLYLKYTKQLGNVKSSIEDLFEAAG